MDLKRFKKSLEKDTLFNPQSPFSSPFSSPILSPVSSPTLNSNNKINTNKSNQQNNINNNKQNNNSSSNSNQNDDILKSNNSGKDQQPKPAINDLLFKYFFKLDKEASLRGFAEYDSDNEKESNVETKFILGSPVLVKKKKIQKQEIC